MYLIGLDGVCWNFSGDWFSMVFVRLWYIAIQLYQCLILLCVLNKMMIQIRGSFNYFFNVCIEKICIVFTIMCRKIQNYTPTYLLIFDMIFGQ